MDATQMIDDSILESDEEENEEENGNKRGEPLAKLRVFKNEHIPETELPLYLGDNVLGRDPNTCTLLLPAPSVSKQHSTICISVLHGRGRHSAVVIEALVWDLGSMNGTRKGCFKLTPQVRYALSEGDRLVVADIPCQYVSCAVDKISGQGDMRTPVNRDSGERARRSDALRENGCDTSTDTGKCVNGDTKAPAMVSSPDQEETSKTPARTRCLSFEQTPTQPQGTLVPESDLDSDEERGGRRERQAKTLVSDSDSHISSPTCSTFLSPTNKIIPESEDESPITPSSTKDRTNKRVSFSKEERDVDVGRQQLKKKRAQVIVDDSEEEEERAAPGGREPEQSGQDVPIIQENNVSLSGEDGLPVSTPGVSTDAIHVFNMDSDTDVEGEEEGVESAGPVTFSTLPPADDPTKLVQFQMDSNTDVDEDDDVLDYGPKSVPVSNDATKPPDSLPVVEPTRITLDSDTDVDDDVSDTATKETPTSLQSVHTADSAPSTQPKDSHLDSDTDVDEEEESDIEMKSMCSEIDETPSRIDLKPSRVESTSAASHSLPLDSDTDDEVISVPASSNLAVVALDTKPPTTADTGADMNILSDSDTDLEDDAPLLPAAASSAEAPSVCLSTAPVGRSTALQSDSDADTDVDEPSMPPAGVEADRANFRLDSDTDVEDEGAGPSEAGVGQTSGLSGEKASGLPGGLVPPLQKCSTPLQLSERVVEQMETQAFVCDQVSPPAMRLVILPSSSSDSQEDNDFVVAETQSFVLETRDCQGSLPHDPTLDATQAFGLEPSSDDEKYEQCSRGGSFQLGLSDSSRLQAQALAMENTQAFVTLNGDVNLEATQAYGNISPLDRTSVEDSKLDTQAYGGDEEPARCSIVSEKVRQVDFALEATQAYIPEPHSDPEDETEGDERTNIATAETLDFPTSEYLSTAETLPMAACEDEESDDEDLIPAPRKKKATPLQLEEEETQTFTSSELCAVETQPMFFHDDDNEEDDIVTKAPSRKRRGRPQTKKLKVLTSTHISNTENQPIASCEMGEEEEEHEEEETKAGLQKAKGQPQRGKRRESEAGTSGISSRSKRGSRARSGEDKMQEEPPKRQEDGDTTQRQEVVTSEYLSTAETLPMAACEDEESDDEDLIPAPRQKKAKPLQLEEEETQTFTSSELCAVETQPMFFHDYNEEDEIVTEAPSLKRRGRPQTKKLKVLTSTHISDTENQPMTSCEMGEEEEEHEEEETKAGLQKAKGQPQRGKRRESEAGTSGISSRSKRGSRARSGEDEMQEEPPKRQEDGDTTQRQEVVTSEYLSTAETLPMAACDDEDLIPAPRKKKAKSLQLEEEETQTFTSSELCAVETQPMFFHDDCNEEDEIVTEAPSLKRRGRPQTKKLKVLTSTHISDTENQPIASCEMGEEEEEHEEEETKAGLQKAKGQPQRGKRRESEAGTSGISSRSKRGSRARSGEDEMQEEPPKRQTRGKGKALSTTRGRRGKVRPEEEEEEVEQAKRGRGRKTMKHHKDEREEKERLEMERKEQAEKDRLLKEQEEQVRGQALEEQEKERREEELRERERARLEKERREEQEKLEKEEQERLKSENAEREEKFRLEQEREERERIEREEKERLERERKKQEEKERMERERKEQEEKERLDRLCKEKEEEERLERERKEKEVQERLEKERKEKEEQERLKCERAEREEKERLAQEREEKERLERERKEQEQKERLDRIRKEKEEHERLERERKEKEEQERLKCERAEREEKERLEQEREEKERLERERKEQEQKERLDRIRKEKEEHERLERERKEKEEQERLKCEKAEREEKERLEREEKNRIERERKEREEKERLERVQKEVEEQGRLQREKKEQEHQARLEREKKEREEGEKREKERLKKEAKEKQVKDQQENKDEENKPNMSTRGRRASRRTTVAPSTTKPEPDPDDDVPARRTRSRSNSSNSVSSERSASSVTTLESRGRGRGRGAKKTSQPALENISRDSNRRRTVAAEREATEQSINHVPAPGILSRSNSTNSLNSEISSCSVSTQNRGRGRKTDPETNSIPPINSQSDQKSTPKATARDRKSRKVEDSSNDVSQVDGEEKADSQQPSTTRGRRRASANASGSQTQAVEIPTEDSLLPKRNVRGRGQISKCETLVTPVAAVVNDADEAKGKGKGSKRELEEEAEEDESRGAKISRGKAKAQRERGTEAAEEEEKEETKEGNPVPGPAKRRGRSSTTQGKRNAKESCPEVEVKEEKMEEEIVERKARGRQSVAHKKKEEREKEGGTSALNSMDQDASAEASEVPHTTTSSASRKRAAPMNSSPVAKTPRSSVASPGAGGRLRATGQAYKVLFTGVVDEAGERVVPHLGGSLAKGVVDMTCLVTDKVRRTVKFLCAVARGVPIVTTHWLEKSGKAGSFLSPNAFTVKDTEQENKFNFRLQESLRIAGIQPLLQGYEIHVTKSVKPEPVHMKDIISCSGASFLPKMPSSHKAHTIVISCEEDWSLCGPAVSASLPVVTAEFILTGILQQKIDFNTHTLPAPTTNPQPAGGRGRGRKKT